MLRERKAGSAKLTNKNDAAHDSPFSEHLLRQGASKADD